MLAIIVVMVFSAVVVFLAVFVVFPPVPLEEIANITPRTKEIITIKERIVAIRAFLNEDNSQFNFITWFE